MEEGANITGDPQIFIYQEYYVMLYFVLKDGKTYNNFALSHDLVHWEKWSGKPLVESEYEWENQFAHKVSFVIWNGVCYHFYCATNTNGERFIALATSKKIK